MRSRSCGRGRAVPALLDGVLVGAGAGISLGVLLGGVLEATARSDGEVAEADEQTV